MRAPLIIDLPNEDATTRLGQALATLLRAGDSLLLDGPIGTGKSHLARALIRARLGPEEDVPSPTFTLVQTYQGDPDIWHADLYRLTHPDEVVELGLEDAFATAICLIEWPDRLGSILPDNPMRLTLETRGAGRRAVLCSGDRPCFDNVLTAHLRALAIDSFLGTAGWSHAAREPLAGDASARRYERLTRGDQSIGAQTAILMDAPPGQADSVADFVKIDQHLLGLGLSAPRIMAQDSAQGFLLLEDFGNGLYPPLICANPGLEATLYQAATDVLLHLQSHPAATDLTDLTSNDWAEAATFAIDWYRKGVLGDVAGRAEFVSVLAQTLQGYADGPRVMILRDYHAENLLWLPDRLGLSRVGLLDFQLAQLGQPGYDLVSLLQDARRDVPEAVEVAMVALFAAAQGTDSAAFRASYAALGAQRALRILGIFARLCLKEGKPRYTALIPRVWSQLQRNLSHPALKNLQTACARLLPAPTAQALQKLEAQCGAFR
jgi:tRNA threonylcarbamoyl adenosine modification protein YjeE